MSEHVKLRERRHPEEYSSRHMFSMTGIWGVPTRNARYTGRESRLEELYRMLFSSSVLNIVEVVGMGGVGKTTLVSEFCHRHYQSSTFSLIIWLRAESSASIAADFRRFGTEFGILGASDNSDATVVESVHQALLRSRSNYLLVFDNIQDHEKVINNFVPKGIQSVDGFSAGGTGHVVITSRISSGRPKVLNLGCYDSEESVAFLCSSLNSNQTRSPDHQRDLAALADKLGHLPLALEMAASYISSSEVSPNEYRRRLSFSMDQTNHATLEDVNLVALSLNMTLMRIEAVSSLAKPLLCMISLIDPDSISKDLLALLLTQHLQDRVAVPASNSIRDLIRLNCGAGFGVLCGITVVVSESPYLRLLCVIVVSLMFHAGLIKHGDCPVRDSWERSQGGGCAGDEDISLIVDRLWDLLRKYSLLFSVGKEGTPQGRIHRLQAAAIRLTLPMADKVTFLKRNIAAFDRGWHFSRKDPSTWESSGENLKHLVAMIPHVKDALARDDPALLRSLGLDSIRNFCLLIVDGGSYLAVALSRFDSAQNLLEQSYQFLRQLQNFNGVDIRADIALNLSRLGRLLRYNGDFVKSQECLSEALDYCEVLHEDPLLSDTLHELGVLAIRKHDLNLAESYLLKSLTLKRQYVNDAWSIAGTLHQLAVVATANGQYGHAVVLLHECLELEDRATVSKAATLQQLGRVALRRGFTAEAREHFLDSLGIYLSIYGPESRHINIAGSIKIVYIFICLTLLHRRVSSTRSDVEFRSKLQHCKGIFSKGPFIQGEYLLRL